MSQLIKVNLVFRKFKYIEQYKFKRMDRVLAVRIYGIVGIFTVNSAKCGKWVLITCEQRKPSSRSAYESARAIRTQLSYFTHY